MQDIKTVFVTGATGNQGGAAIRYLLKSGFSVKALVRDPSLEKARSITRENVEIIKGNLNQPESYKQHLKNCDAVFCNLHFTEGVVKEVQQGINLMTAAKDAGIKFIVYSSVIGCDINTGIPHWESKWEIEKFIVSTGIPFTILRPASLYENLLMPAVKSRILKGKLVLPTKADKVQQFICSDDIGRIAAIIFSNPVKYAGRTIVLAAEEMNGKQLAEIFSKVLKREIKYQQLPMFIVRLFMGKDLAKMFRWVNNNDVRFVKDISGLKEEFPGMLSIEEWIGINYL